MSAATGKPPAALLFDLGRVLIDFSFERALAHWSGYSSLRPDEMAERFRFDEPYQQHERGEIASADYFDYLIARLELKATRDEVREGWNGIFIGEIAPTRELLEKVRRRVPCYAFTNTNAEHMVTWTALFPEVFASFVSVFASFEIGLRKPEQAAFDYVCRHIGVSAESILFFDDLAENVDGARRAGLASVLVQSPDDVACALREFL
jgi:putative hydrolase of the HAD superfamily